MNRKRLLRTIGPGLAIAATGVGAGDLMAAMLAGAEFGAVLLWVVVVGAALKFCLNEGVARWQLATGTTLLEGWNRHLGRPFSVLFLLYLVVWSFIVAAGLMSACGVAAHAVVPGLGIRFWGIIHSLVALALVAAGRYGLFERLMKVLVGLMVMTLVASVLIVDVDWGAALRGLLLPLLPAGSAATVLGLMGGVGGSVTLLAYGYWIRERGWTGRDRISEVRLDLGVGYLLTGIFGLAMLLLAAAVLGGRGAGMPEGSAGLVALGEAIRSAVATGTAGGAGRAAGLVFLIGVWAAVATSTLGVWQGVPYLFGDFLAVLRRETADTVSTTGLPYRAYLLYLALPPMVLLFIDRPVWVIRLYTMTSGLFMPFLAGSLLWLTTRRRLVGSLTVGRLAAAGLVAALCLFVALGVRQLLG